MSSPPHRDEVVEQRRKILLAVGEKVSPGVLLYCIKRMNGDEKAGRELHQRTLATFASGARTFLVKPGEPIDPLRVLRFLFGLAKSLDDRRAPEHHLFVPLDVDGPDSGPIERPETATHDHAEKLLETAQLRQEALTLLREELADDAEAVAVFDVQLEGDLSVDEKVERLRLRDRAHYFAINKRIDRAIERVRKKMMRKVAS